jgi:hypothetical protein
MPHKTPQILRERTEAFLGSFGAAPSIINRQVKKLNQGMTHSEKRASPWREAQLGLFTGGLYGATHTISGHPLDTIKSRMQVNPDYLKLSTMQTTLKIWRDEGARGFFRGMLPPLWGSSVYRAVMLSSYEYSFTYFSQNYDKDHVVNSEYFGVRPIVFCSAFFSSSVRSAVENPIEYAKVMGQTGKSWVLADVYRGTSAQVIRNTGLLVPIFVLMDVFRRHTDLMKSTAGLFAVTCGSASLGYLLAWPLETLKNLAQTATPRIGATISERVSYLGGLRGLYRGVVPGTVCGGFRNACGMVVLTYAQAYATKRGLRNE